MAANPYLDYLGIQKADSTTPTRGSGNPYLDMINSAKPQEQPPENQGGFIDTAKDYGISALKGAIAVPESAVGLADIATGGRVGKALEGVGYRPQEANQFLDTLYSPGQQDANKAVNDAQGFLPTLGALAEHPSVAAHSVVQSAPLMLGGQLAARGAMALAPKLSPLAAGAIGEGLATAGQNAEQVRYQTPDRTLNPTQSAIQAGSGALTGAITAASGGLANRLGLTDINQILLGQQANKATGLAGRVIGGGLAEGGQELAQSAQEQAASNLALNRPVGEGVGNQAAVGFVTGAAMGAPTGILAPSHLENDKKPTNELNLGPLTKAVNSNPTETANATLQPGSPIGNNPPAAGNNQPVAAAQPGINADAGTGQPGLDVGRTDRGLGGLAGRQDRAGGELGSALDGQETLPPVAVNPPLAQDQGSEAGLPNPDGVVQGAALRPTHEDGNGNLYFATQDPYVFRDTEGNEWVDEQGQITPIKQNPKDAYAQAERKAIQSEDNAQDDFVDNIPSFDAPKQKQDLANEYTTNQPTKGVESEDLGFKYLTQDADAFYNEFKGLSFDDYQKAKTKIEEIIKNYQPILKNPVNILGNPMPESSFDKHQREMFVRLAKNNAIENINAAHNRLIEEYKTEHKLKIERLNEERVARISKEKQDAELRRKEEEEANKQKPDTKPGNYYVTANYDGKTGYLAGPFKDHQSALDMVDKAREEANKVDPRAAFAAYGTARVPLDSKIKPVGKLNNQLGVNQEPAQKTPESIQVKDDLSKKGENVSTSPVKGIVGGKLSPGEKQITASGRETTPFPKDNRTTRNADAWLIRNAMMEAESRGDDFNSRIFKTDLEQVIKAKAKNGKYIPQASKDAAEEYLFGQQPDVPKPFLKPLSTPSTQPENVSMKAENKDISTSVAPWNNNVDQDTDRWHGTRVEISPQYKGESAIQGTVTNVLKGSHTAVVTVKPDGMDSTFRYSPDRLNVLSLVDKNTGEVAGEVAGEVSPPQPEVKQAKPEKISETEKNKPKDEKQGEEAIKSLSDRLNLLADMMPSGTFSEKNNQSQARFLSKRLVDSNGMTADEIREDLLSVSNELFKTGYQPLSEVIDDIADKYSNGYETGSDYVKSQETLGEDNGAGLKEGAKPSKPDESESKYDSLKFADKLLNGDSFKTIVQARKALTDEAIEPGTQSAKQADEAIELAGVLAARKIVGKGDSQEKTFDALVNLASNMPSLNVRSSTSVAQQAYSTPLPLAYIASVRAGINDKTTVIEPTAGNGALLIGANPSVTVANELNPDRFENLKKQGFEPYNKDASAFDFGKKDTDVVIANPPFGVVRDEDGNSITFQINKEYATNEIDHAISLNALKAMKDDGTAVLIVGAPAKTLSEEGRSNAYNGKAKRAFYYTLYRDYNVVDQFTVSGELYAKQGAAWPVDVIVIKGRGKSILKLPAAALPRIINSIEDLKNELQDRGQHLQQDSLPNAKNDSSRSEISDDAGESITQRVRNARPAKNDKPEGLLPRPEPTPESPRPSAASTNTDTGNDTANRPVRNNNAANKVENKFQSTYNPASAAKSVDTLVPVNMQSAINEALDKVAQEADGSVDRYVANLLEYKESEIPQYFSAEQVDAIALALRNIKSGKGFIIGDQTGVGKGRVNAAMIRYAIKNKMNPVFVTEKPNLYGDIIRDLNDIGMTDIKPFATNTAFSIPIDDEANEWYALAEKAKENGNKVPPQYGRFIKTPGGTAHNKAMFDIQSSGSLGDYHVVFTTYNQMQTVKGAKTPRMEFLESIINGGLLILDESHNAGGTEVQGFRKEDKSDEGEKGGRAGFVRKLVKNAKGVFYSSATYAKRPEVLDLYSKTDMGLVADPNSLKESLQAGGVPLQQAVAAMLAKAGQYIRREKSFDGINYETETVDVDRDFAENASEIMRDIMKFDDIKALSIKQLGDSLKSDARKVTGDKSTGGAGATSTNFTSVMHNMIGQMLLMLKVKPTVKLALDALERGEKPVIALSNTMGSAIEEYAGDVGLNPGDAINLHFGDLLKRYLSKSRRVIEGDAFGKKESRMLTNEELGPMAVKFYNSVMKKIDRMGFEDYPISPIDYIHSEMAKAGYKSDEITGRGVMIDYSEGVPIYRRRSSTATTPAGKRKVINDFNNGRLDVIVLNQSGATGLSLHSSPKVGTDTRKRTMFIAQPELNIDTHMQMLGRVNRTGQLLVPGYKQIAANIPSEKRPAAILGKKMAALNANTTASKDSAVKAKGVPDFMNQYGDEVAAALMNDNRDIHKLLGKPLAENSTGDGFEVDGAIRKITGRIPVLKLSDQESLYAALEDAYNDYIDTLNKTGQNGLEAQSLPLDAKTISSTEVVAPIVGHGDSPFALGVNALTVDAKKLGKPYTLEQVAELLAKKGITEDYSSKTKYRDDFISEINSELESATEELKSRLTGDEGEDKSTRAQMNQLEHKAGILRRMAQILPGKEITLMSPQGYPFAAIMGTIERKGSAKNYFALGSWKATFYVADAAKSFTIPVSKIENGSESAWTTQAPIFDVKEAFRDGLNTTRVNRTILQGNMLAAYGFDKSGSIVNYTDDKGAIQQGILMPLRFDLKEAIAAKPVVFQTPQDAIDFINHVPEFAKRMLRSADGSVRLNYIADNRARLWVPAAKSTGGVYFTNKRLTSIAGDFYKQGSEMRLTVESKDIPEILRIIYPSTGPMQPAFKDTGKQFLESRGVKYSKSAKTSGRTVADIRNQLPGYAKRMLLDGRLVIEQSGKEGVEGYYKDGKIHLVADNLNADNLKGTLLHEAFHYSLETDPKTKAAVQRFEKSTKGRFNMASKGIGSELEKAAYKRVINAGTPLADQVQEFQSYLISQYEKNPTSFIGAIKKVFQDFIASIRAALMRMDVPFRDITPADLSALARYSVKSNYSEIPNSSSETVLASKSGIGETILVDGKERPTRNSNGKLIHQTEEGIINFWKWFGASITVDDNGRPKTFYHGTASSFNKFSDKKVGKTYGVDDKGFFFADTPEEPGYIAIHDAKGKYPNVLPVYLKITNPLKSYYQDYKWKPWEKKSATNLLDWKKEELFYAYENERVYSEDANYDGILVTGDDGTDAVVFNPNQIKSAIGNTGRFSPSSDNIKYSKSFDIHEDAPDWARNFADKATQEIRDRLQTSRTFNLLNRSVNTQAFKAWKDKDYKAVFDKSVAFEQSTAKLANEAADVAPSLLPKLESFVESAKEVKQGFQRTRDATKIGKAIFDTTIQDKVMTDAELEAAGYTPGQITMYHEFFSAVNKSLDNVALSEMARLARAKKLATAPERMGLDDAAKFYAEQAENPDDAKDFLDKADSINKLKQSGYAPLQRFGQYTVNVMEEGHKTPAYFGMYESEAEANKDARIMRELYPEADVKSGVMSQNDWQMFKGVTPESMETFAKLMGIDQDKAFQEYLKLAVNNQSAMKRLIHRKKVEGYSIDPQRVLATFITSNARMAAKNLHIGDMLDAISKIPKEKGDVRDEAVDLYNYVQNPGAAGAGVRNALFAWYLGGSIAASAVNLTQSFTTTYPALHQLGSAKEVAVNLGRAMKMAMNPKAIGGELGKALKMAEEEGVTAPHELHMLYGESMRTGFANAVKPLRPIAKAWGAWFSLAEGYNRRVAFIAAYNMTKGTPGQKFKAAEQMVNDTQFQYSKSSRPNLARGTVGSALFTFKTFTINYLEFLRKMPPKERAIALGVLIMMAGASGLPGADDLDDLIDSVGQSLGYNTNSRDWKEQHINKMILYGMSSVLPVDISSRIGVGNLIPGSAMFKRSETDKTRDVLEFIGPAGTLSKNIVEAFDSMAGRQGIAAKVGAATHAALPKAVADIAKAYDIATTGQYRDYRGYKVVEASLADAAAKAIGFQPSSVAEARRPERLFRQYKELATKTESEISDIWAAGIYEKDREKVDEARELLKSWNAKNPETPIRIKYQQIVRRVKEMRKSSAERLIKTSPRELRRLAGSMLE